MQLLIESKPRPPSTTPAPFPCTTDLHAYVKPDPGILDVSQFGNVLRLETITSAGMITDGGDVHPACLFSLSNVQDGGRLAAPPRSTLYEHFI